MMSQAELRHAALIASAATTELITQILAKYPQAQISNTAPLSDEDISLEGLLPMSMSEIYAVRDWICDIVIELEERYDLAIQVSVIPSAGQNQL
jgi:hypothetical protein